VNIQAYQNHVFITPQFNIPFVSNLDTIILTWK